jgi:putative glycerol-1-phosphate prenyltransferase
MKKIFTQMLENAFQKGGGYFVLIDPDTPRANNLGEYTRELCIAGVDAILVGGSLILDADFANTLQQVKKNSTVPVIIFPGSLQQLSGEADAILYISLISGRNPNSLFGDHVIAAPFIRKLAIEPISTGYMLFESGRTTTAEFMSHTRPLPVNKPEIAMAHALAAQYMGMQIIYLEAGSGADHAIPDEVVQAVYGYVDIPIIVGGGIRNPVEARQKIEAGARFVVTGNVLDDQNDPQLIRDFVRAVHIKEFS